MKEVPQIVKNALLNIQRADDEAELAQVAFATGKFSEHFEAKVTDARTRLEENYRELTKRASEQQPFSTGEHYDPTAED